MGKKWFEIDPKRKAETEEELAELWAWGSKRAHRREHGTDPMTHKEYCEAVQENLDNWTPEKDAARRAYLAEGTLKSIAYKQLHQNPLRPDNPNEVEAEELSASSRLDKAKQDYLKLTGKNLDLSEPKSLRVQILDLLGRGCEKSWTTEEIAEKLKFPVDRVRVVLEFLWEESKATSVTR